MNFYDSIEDAGRAADACAEQYGGIWVVHSVANEARTRLRYVAVNSSLGWHLPVHYRTGRVGGDK